jgi:hypothetical protein
MSLRQPRVQTDTTKTRCHEVSVGSPSETPYSVVRGSTFAPITIRSFRDLRPLLKDDAIEYGTIRGRMTIMTNDLKTAYQNMSRQLTFSELDLEEGHQ